MAATVREEENQKFVKRSKNSGAGPIFLDNGAMRSLLSYQSLLQHLQYSFPSVSTAIQSPIRQNYSIDSSSSLLLMPSWSLSPFLPYIGVKLVTSYPQNSARNLPGIHASYLLFDSTTGQPVAVMDGTELTLWRTACVSALASKFLSREDSEVLVMIGAGSLAPYLVKAHASVRPNLKKVIIWNRRVERASDLAKKLQEEEDLNGVCFEHTECLNEIIGLGDIVSCATSSESPIVMGGALKAGAHLDLVGSFTPSMRECDDEAIKRGRVFVDCEAALIEAGELVGAFQRGVLSHEEIGGSLVDLIKGDKVGRNSSEEITLFKSVGSAVVDILSAQLVYESYLDANL
ncbi:PREDICTED: uncharacterized protein LOC104613056 [Nelumbo nucifera]|uniref:Protein SAR DEFICIENT 4 n=2 Tax=Nelumbo nucifera TaxID=4432 RepID=A0A822ZY47_NELNU|nr:PREDICTED: uncharacterized protein LOC104613056 [Nelumbo nucifera]DAD46848.1 TPA_asm: hypothetical protein HUJ06_016785 [Nelumbo nucifera]